MNDAAIGHMVRWLNILIVVLLLAWVLGMIFSAIFGLLVHLLLVFAVVAVIMRLYHGIGRRRREARSIRADDPERPRT
jgi:fatty-acid desaturase